MSVNGTWKSETDFERDVIRICRSLWPAAAVAGSVMLENAERDGIFITEEAIHIVECTTSRSKQKAVDDTEKSVKLSRSLRKQYADKPIQCWFVTADEPTADQRAVALTKKECPVSAISYAALRNKLIDASTYLNVRREYAFGSARNPQDGSAKLDRGAYAELDLLRLNDSTSWSIHKVVEALLRGDLTRALLLGDFGAGKSMSMREAYLKIEAAYHKGRSNRFPVYLNLRDHGGQPEPVEILERHARRIGFANPSHLVRAWRAGYVVLILDGFDELSSTGWMAFNARLRDVRFATVEAVRRFLDESPSDAPVIVAGRVSYFDNENECLQALGLDRRAAWIFSLNDFSNEQIAAYLKRFGLAVELPPWLPARPLLIGYLATRGALSGDEQGDFDDPGSGWDDLLGRVCDREARTHAGVEPKTVRHLIEDLASTAREKRGIEAPLTPIDMMQSYRRVVGIEPDARAETLLMRLPGLGVAPSGGARSFVDADFGGAAAAGDVTRFIDNPFGIGDAPINRVKEVLQETGIATALHQVKNKEIANEKLYVALQRAAEIGDRAQGEHGLAVDIVKVLMSGAFAEPREYPRITLREVIIDELDLTSKPKGLSGVRLVDCLLSTLYMPLSRQDDDNLPRFSGGQIEHIEGRASASELSQAMFKEVQFGTFSAVPATNAAVIDDDTLEVGLKGLVTVLRKLFFQKGSGRKENAFYRGVPGIGTFVIDQALELVKSADYAQRSKRGGAEAIWEPNRRMTARAKAIVSAPRASTEAIAVAARTIGVRNS